MTHISLTHEDFKTLVNGGIVEKNGCRILLQDIGFAVMYSEIDDAQMNMQLNTLLGYE